MRKTGSVRVCLLVALAACAPAWAQEPPPPRADAEPLTEPGELEPLDASDVVAPFVGEAAWFAIGPPEAGPLADVAVSSGPGGMIGVVENSGALWLSTNDGLTWRRVLDAADPSAGFLSREEAVRREIEARLEELERGDEPLDGVPSYDDEAADFADELERIVDEIQTEIESNPWFLDGDDLRPGPAGAVRSRLWFSDDGAIFVGRPDGLWISDDLGGLWRTPIREPVEALVFSTSHDLWLAGTHDGVKVSRDLVQWWRPDADTDGIRVHDLSEGAVGVYAATDDGLWFSADGVDWEPRGPFSDSVYAVLADPAWDTGVWLGLGYDLRRSEDAGDTLLPSTRAALPGVVDLVSLGAGHLLVASPDGPWESVDGGDTWASLYRGLSRPRAYALAVAPSGPLLASDDGLSRLERVLLAAPERAPSEDELPIAALVSAAVGRPGLVPERSSYASTRLTRAVVPAVRVSFLDHVAGGADWRASRGVTERDDRDDWRLLAELQFKPARSPVSAVDVLVPEGAYDEVMILADDTAMAVEARVRRDAVRYVEDVIGHVTELTYAREALVRRRPEARTRPVLDQTDLELHIAELEARLDLLTDGALSRWKATRAQETP